MCARFCGVSLDFFEISLNSPRVLGTQVGHFLCGRGVPCVHSRCLWICDVCLVAVYAFYGVSCECPCVSVRCGVRCGVCGCVWAKTGAAGMRQTGRFHFNAPVRQIAFLEVNWAK